MASKSLASFHQSFECLRYLHPLVADNGIPTSCQVSIQILLSVKIRQDPELLMNQWLPGRFREKKSSQSPQPAEPRSSGGPIVTCLRGQSRDHVFSVSLWRQVLIFNQLVVFQSCSLWEYASEDESAADSHPLHFISWGPALWPRPLTHRTEWGCSPGWVSKCTIPHATFFTFI